MKIKNKILFTFTTLALSSTTSLLAEELLSSFHGTWGLGVSALDSNYKNSDTEVSLAPFIFGGIGKLEIEANRVLYPLYKSPSYGVYVTGNYRTQQYSEELNLDRSIEAGLTLDVELIPNLNARFTALADISGKHDGYELETQLYRHDNLGNFSILSTIALQYQDESLANYYYSTNNYTAGDGYVFEAEVIASYPINNFSIFTGARSYWYENNVGNSPLASSSNTILGFAGVGYKF